MRTWGGHGEEIRAVDMRHDTGLTTEQDKGWTTGDEANTIGDHNDKTLHAFK